MIYYNNLAQTKQAIQRYVEAGDYSRPHIVAVEMVCPELDTFISENKTILTHQEELDSILSQPVDATRPWYIYIVHSKIREWLESIRCECDINVYAFDREEWLKNCAAINPATGRRVIDRFYLDFLKQAPDDYILFYPQEKHSGMTCNIPDKWVSASSTLYNELQRFLVVAAKANGNKNKKREEINHMVRPTLDSVFVDGNIDWSRLADILETFPEDVWQTCCILPNRYKATAATLSRVDCFKMVAVSLVDCVTPNVYDALLEFHGLPAIP